MSAALTVSATAADTKPWEEVGCPVKQHCGPGRGHHEGAAEHDPADDRALAQLPEVNDPGADEGSHRGRDDHRVVGMDDPLMKLKTSTWMPSQRPHSR